MGTEKLCADYGWPTHADNASNAVDTDSHVAQCDSSAATCSITDRAIQVVTSHPAFRVFLVMWSWTAVARE
eukprot:1048315-Amphidinium_carterae.1